MGYSNHSFRYLGKVGVGCVILHQLLHHESDGGRGYPLSETKKKRYASAE